MLFLQTNKGTHGFHAMCPSFLINPVLILWVPLLHHLPLKPKPLGCPRLATSHINTLHIFNDGFAILLVNEICPIPNGSCRFPVPSINPSRSRNGFCRSSSEIRPGLKKQVQLTFSGMFLHTCTPSRVPQL